VRGTRGGQVVCQVVGHRRDAVGPKPDVGLNPRTGLRSNGEGTELTCGLLRRPDQPAAKDTLAASVVQLPVDFVAQPLIVRTTAASTRCGNGKKRTASCLRL
jgi:hypothetical protein